MKSLKTSTACSSPLTTTTDVCKENKERHTTNKPSISYGKKEKSTTVSLNRKKVVIASTSAAPPIPTKRQKVVANKKFSVGDKVETKDSTIDLDMNAMNNLNIKSDDVNPMAQNVSASETEDLSAFIDQPTTSFDPNMPCCSYQLLPQPSSSFNPFKYPNVPKKSTSFLRKSTASTSSMLISQSSIAQNAKVKSSAIKLRGGFNSAGSTSNGSRLKSLRKSSLTKDGRRMKKKKSLKADTGKRKKSKVF